MSILIFLGVLFVLVLVHELGHFAVAKWTGMRVDEFGIGFPPKLFGIKKGETLYSINAFPVGGFVKIFGEDATNVASSPVSSETRDHRSEALAEAGEGGEDGAGDPSARPAEDLSERSEREIPAGVLPRYGEDMEAVVADDADARNRSFTSKSKWAQSAVLIAGISMNILFAWMLMVVVFTTGVETSVTESEASENAKLVITNVLPESPADKVQITPGSVIKSMQAGNETLATLTPSAFSGFVESHAGKPLTIVYTYQGEPRVVQLESETDIIVDKPAQHAVGVALTQVDTVKRSFTESTSEAFVFTVTGLRDIAVGLASLFYDAIRFKADFSQVAGPIGIVGLVGEASAFGITALLMFTAFISLNLAVINILPFPALDGGRLLFVIIEAVKGSPITPKYVATMNIVGFVLLIMLMVAVTWNDVARLL